MIRYREQLKNYQCEMSINNFYQHPYFKQYSNQDSIRSNISPNITLDIKNKFISELKKVKQKAVLLELKIPMFRFFLINFKFWYFSYFHVVSNFNVYINHLYKLAEYLSIDFLYFPVLTFHILSYLD